MKDLRIFGERSENAGGQTIHGNISMESWRSLRFVVVVVVVIVVVVVVVV